MVNILATTFGKQFRNYLEFRKACMAFGVFMANVFAFVFIAASFMIFVILRM